MSEYSKKQAEKDASSNHGPRKFDNYQDQQDYDAVYNKKKAGN